MKKMFLMAAALWLLSCKKEVSELPAATQTGANTFGAKVNGKLWVPQGFGVAPTAPLLQARYGGPERSVFIQARNFSGEPLETEFEIYLQNVRTPGTYLLNANTDKYPAHAGNYAYYVERKITPLNEWITSAQYTGQVNVSRMDTVANVISGTFEFTAANMSGAGQPLTVTEGRFDVKIP